MKQSPLFLCSMKEGIHRQFPLQLKTPPERLDKNYPYHNAIHMTLPELPGQQNDRRTGRSLTTESLTGAVASREAGTALSSPCYPSNRR